MDDTRPWGGFFVIDENTIRKIYKRIFWKHGDKKLKG